MNMTVFSVYHAWYHTVVRLHTYTKATPPDSHSSQIFSPLMRAVVKPSCTG